MKRVVGQGWGMGQGLERASTEFVLQENISQVVGVKYL